VIHAAGTRALAAGATLDSVLEIGQGLAEHAPFVPMVYANMALAKGAQEFAAMLVGAGASGAIIPDLPLGEADELGDALRDAGIAPVPLVAPTTPEDRMEMIVKRATGFVYYVSREGVTGMQQKVSDTIAQMTAKIRAHTDLPIAVGFGISTPEQARTVAASAEAIVVGSAIVNQIAEYGKSDDLVAKVAGFVKSLAAAAN
jgi:tryptophan synthase alpha chain